MADIAFEQMPGIDLNVTSFTATVAEQGGMAPSTVLRTNQAWELRVHWTVTGDSAPFVRGTWRAEGYLESMGAGPEFEIPQQETPMAGPGDYTIILSVPAGQVTLAPGEQSTPFKLVTTLTARDLGGFCWPMAGYVEGPILQFYRMP